MVPRLIFAFIAVFTLYGSIRKPAFFWEHPKARTLREIMGDKGASLFYMFLGFLFVLAALFGRFP